MKVPDIEKTKIGINDFYRLENKMAFALYLQAKGMNYQQFIKTSSKDDDNILFGSQLDRRNFYFFGNKAKINQVLDLRVEDMVLTPQFFNEITDFAEQLTQQAPFQIKINPLLRSIGFLETIQFLNSLYRFKNKDGEESSQLYFDYRRRYDVKKYYQAQLGFYLDDFKAKTR